MICSDCGYKDIRYNEKERMHHCNNCGSKNIRKEGCRFMLKNGACGKNPCGTSSGMCKTPCSYYESHPINKEVSK